MKASFFGLRLFYVLFFLLILSGLISNSFFYDPTKPAYFGFVVFTFLILILSTLLGDSPLANIKTPLLFFLAWCLYIFIQSFFYKVPHNIILYFFSLFFLFISLHGCMIRKGFSLIVLFYVLVVIAALESSFCILQFFGLTESRNPYFEVTGSYTNPNVTAIFLALSTPAFLFVFKRGTKRIITGCFVLLLAALFLLKCRAAFIGTLLSIVIYYSLEYNFISWLKDNKNKTAVRSFVVVSLIILIPLSSTLYNAKKESSEGRKFIWKVSALMAMEKPFFGYGYGNFEREYNLYQAHYIGSGRANNTELKNAGPVIMPHNEIIYNLTQGGVTGLLFMMGFFGSLLLLSRFKEDNRVKGPYSYLSKKGCNAAYSGIIAFVAISMVNSTVQVIPLMSLLIVYAALISTFLRPVAFPSLVMSSGTTRRSLLLTKVFVVILSGCILVNLYESFFAQRQNKIAELLQKQSRFTEASLIMTGLKEDLGEDADFWKNYALIHLKAGRYDQAIKCLEEAKKYSALPELYLASAVCFEKTRRYDKAAGQYRQLTLMLPSKFSYRFSLMNAYLSNRDTISARAAGIEILELEPRIPSAKVQKYKSETARLLKKISPDQIKESAKKDTPTLAFRELK